MARYSEPDTKDVHALSRSVLAIKVAPDAQVTHSWEPLSSLDPSKLPSRALDRRMQGRIVRAAWTRNCEDEFGGCIAMCVKSLDGPDWSHAKELLVGTVVVIAGVTFVVVVAGSGGTALVLAPAVLLVSSDVASDSQLAAVKP